MLKGWIIFNIPRDFLMELEKFDHVLTIINEAKSKTEYVININLIKLYLEIGKHISNEVSSSQWGNGTVEQLAKHIASNGIASKGFSARNLWRMRQFYECYSNYPKLSALLTEINWSNHLHILSKTTSIEEKEFYLTLAAKNRYSERDFAKLIDKSTFERTMLAEKKLPALLTEFPVNM